MGNCLAPPKAKGEDARVELEGVYIEYDKPASADYEVIRKLGQGMQGTVYLAVSKSDTPKNFAIKETHIGGRRRKTVRAEAYAELETLNRMRHPNVVRLIAAYQTNTELQLVLELVDGKNILRYLIECDARVREDPNCEPDVREEKFDLMRQLVDAVAHVHARGVVFRDLQPDNVLVTNSTGKDSKRQIKLIDFGRACKLERQTRLDAGLDPMGTTIFQAPEVETKQAYGQPADMWAVGVFLYLMIGDSMPFERSLEGYYQVLRGAYAPFSDAFSSSARDLVSKLLKTNPSARINAPQAKQHRYLRLRTRGTTKFLSEGNVMSAREMHVQNETDQQFVLDSLEAFIVHGQFEDEVIQILANHLEPDDFETVRAWLSMSAETSVHAGTTYPHGIDSVHSFDSSDDDATHHGQLALQMLKQGSSLPLTALKEKSEVAPPEFQNRQFSSNQRSVLGLAHKKGVCSFDELVLGCLSCGLSRAAGRLALAGAAFLERRRGGDGALALDEAQNRLADNLRGGSAKLRLPAGV
jgi:serine/threonine protein kinase